MKTTKRIIAVIAIIATVFCYFALPASATNVSVVNGRSDGSWLFPLNSNYYSSISDWAGCYANSSKRGACPFHGSACAHNANCGADHYNNHGPYGHNGIDIAASRGTPVMAAAGGTLYYQNSNIGSRGLTAVIEHRVNGGNAYYSYYQHLNGFNTSIKSGSTVKAGDVIGYVGSTGGNYGSHLHFGIVFGQAGKGNEAKTGSYLSTLEGKGWITTKGCKYGRIVVNPDTSNSDTRLDTVNSHRGSIHYVFNKNSVKIGESGGGDPVPTWYKNNITKPSSIRYANSFGLRGVISCNAVMTNITAGIYTDSNGKNAKQQVSVNPNSTTYDLNGKVNNSLIFNRLDEGTYYYIVKSTAAGKTQVLINQKFNVYTTYSISNPTKPTNLAKGKSFGLRGVITNDKNLTNVTAGIYTDANGKNAKQKVSVNPNAKSYNLNGKVNNELIFNKLPKGTYYYRVVASNGTSSKVLINQKFTVS